MSLRAPAVLVLSVAAVLGACAPASVVSRGSQGSSEGTEQSPFRSPGSAGELTPTSEASASPPAGGRATTQPSPGPVGASECPNEEATVSDPANRSRGALRGDVDGDGRSEVIWLAVDPRAGASCQVFLAAGSGSVVRSLPIVQPEMNLALSPPALNTLAAIDTEPGLDVVVDLVTGASTRFVGLFGMYSGALERVRFDGPGTLPADLFAYGGSVAHLDGVDCAGRRGTIVVSSASPRAERYAIVRRFYRVTPGGSTPLPVRTERHTVEARALNRFSELGSPPFAGCA